MNSKDFQKVENLDATSIRVEPPVVAFDWTNVSQKVYQAATDKQSSACLPNMEVHYPAPTSTDLLEQYRLKYGEPYDSGARADIRQKLGMLTNADLNEVAHDVDVLYSNNPEKIQGLLDSYQNDMKRLDRLSLAINLEADRRTPNLFIDVSVTPEYWDRRSANVIMFDPCTESIRGYETTEPSKEAVGDL